MRNLWLILTTNFKEKFSHGNYERHFLKKIMVPLDFIFDLKMDFETETKF